MTAEQPRDHEWWTEALTEYFLRPIGPSRTATLAVDREALADLTGLEADDAVESLASAVRDLLGNPPRFAALRVLTRAWKSVDASEPPPALPLLALTVVAANDMGTLPGVRKFDFYRPLRRLLDPADRAGGAPSDFTAVIGGLWKSLEYWLEDVLGGERGQSSFKAHEHYTYIGYSLAQAVLRGSDRTLLHRFFDAVGLEDEEAIPDHERLRHYLERWARRLGVRGSRLVRLATDRDLEKLCESVLEEEFARWRGASPDLEGGGRSGIRLRIELRPTSCMLVVERPADLPDSLHVTALGGNQVVLRELTPNCYQIDPPEVFPLEEVLDSGLVLRVADREFEFAPAPVLAARYMEELGAYVTADRIAYDEAHLLCVEEDQVDALTRFFLDEEVEFQVHGATPLPKRWTLIEGVRFHARPKTDPPPALAPLLGIRRSLQPGLIGGLRVSPLRRSYLAGGEPLLQLPLGSDDDLVRLTRDGGGWRVVDVPRDERGPIQISLRALDLAPGHYTAEVGATGAVTFDIVESIEDGFPSGTGSVQTVVGDVRMCGYSIDDAPPEPEIALVPVAATGKTFAIGASPEEFGFVIEPAWLAELAGGLSWSVLEVPTDFPLAWIVTEHEDGRTTARSVNGLEPRPSRNPVIKWVRLMRKASLDGDGDPQDVARLERYRKEAHKLGLPPKLQLAKRGPRSSPRRRRRR